jgi:hypothetical protein
MRKEIGVVGLLTLIILGMVTFKKMNQADPWRKDQLMEPSELAAILNNKSAHQPMIFSVGFAAGIKNSIVEGPARDSANLAKWKMQLQKIPKNTELVIYCGCCPFDHCPNVRPAFKVLNEMSFSNAKLLDLSHNIRVDWINKGYPTDNSQ